MKKIITWIFALLNVGIAGAHIISVSNNAVNAGQYTNLQTAVTAAHAGDTIYVMGSPTDYGSVTITTPRITIIGAGYNVTDQQYNYNTVVDYVYLNGIVNGVKIQGLYVNNSIQQSGSSVVVDSCDVERCFVTSGVYILGPYWNIRNCDINNVYIQNNNFVHIQNNFLEDIESTNQDSVYVDHNIFATYSGNALYTSISNAQITNNVFYYSNPENSTGCTFKNNITSAGSTINLNSYAGNTGTGNIFATPPGWADATIPASTVTMSAIWKYKWQFTAVSLAHLGATDGSDIGIYGGKYPMPNLTGYCKIPQVNTMNCPANVVQSSLLNVQATAQGIMANGVVSGEYFFDTDPGVGNGASFSVTPFDSVSINMNISVSLLTPTFHVIGLRVKDSSGHWSLYQARQIYVQGPSVAYTAPRITAAEYFFDKDPGQGKGTSVVVTRGDSVNVTTSVAISSLTAGIHNIFIRTKDSSGHWSLYQGQQFYIQSPVVVPSPSRIVAAEYFFDKDPGQGKGTAFTGVTRGDSVNVTSSLAIGSLPAGFHYVFIRSEDSLGRWSLYQGQQIYVQPPVVKPAPSRIVAAEYFYDKDPGQGMGTSIPVTTGDSVNITNVYSTGILATGFHNMFIRTQDSLGRWSLYEGRKFFISPTAPATPPSRIIAAEYFLDKDPGQGMGTPIAVTKGDSVNVIANISTSTMGTGFHYMFVRTEDSLGRWSLYQGQEFFIQPAVSIPSASRIVAAEVFYDKDPGQGKGIPITGITPSDTINMTATPSASTLAIGPHAAFLRVEDSTGHWSLYQGAAFKVEVCTDTVNTAATKDSCFGGNDGTAIGFVTGGKPPFTYSWSSSPVQTTIQATGLSAGIYTITVTDSSGCPATAIAIVGQPSQIKIKPVVSQTTCGQNNGKIAVTVSGGTGTSYKYLWSTGETTTSVSGLATGTYSITVFDKNNCTQTASIKVGAIPMPSISVSSIIPSQCGKKIGSVSVTTTGGTPPYKYSWNNGDSLAVGDSLYGGNYIITVTDTSGCSTYVSAAVTNSNGPVITSNSIGEVKCYGQANGAINIKVTGGLGTYKYLWSTGATTQNVNGLYAGPYYVTVTDTSGCTGIQTFTVTAPAAAVSAVSSSVNSDCSVPTGSGKVMPSGGTPPYAYSWTSGETTDTAQGLYAGVYTVTVTDSNGCSYSAQVAISSKNGPVVIVDSTIASACTKGLGTGSVIINVTGGTGSYSYLWSKQY